MPCRTWPSHRRLLMVEHGHRLDLRHLRVTGRPMTAQRPRHHTFQHRELCARHTRRPRDRCHSCCPLPRSDRISRLNVADLSSDRRMFLTPRIRQNHPPGFIPRTPLKDPSSYPATTPPLPRAARITIFAEARSPWARSDGFTAATRNGRRLPNGSSRRPVRTARPSARSFGTAFLYGFDESSPARKTRPRPADLLQQPQCTPRLRAHLQRLARRQNPTPQPDHRRSVALPPARRRRPHPRRHPRRRRPSQRPDLAAHLETLRPGPEQDPHGTVGAAARRPSCPAEQRPAGARPRPSPGRLPRRPLSHRRLPACAADLLRVA